MDVTEPPASFSGQNDPETNCNPKLDMSDDDNNEIFVCASMLKKIAKIGSEEVLYQLREVADKFHEILNPVYFNNVEPYMIIDSKNIAQKSGIQHSETIALPTADMQVQLLTYKYQVDNTLKKSLVIPQEELASNGHIFRTLALTVSSQTVRMIEIYTQLSAYITKLALVASPIPDSDEWTLSRLINLFPQLIIVKLCVKPVPTIMTLDEIEYLLDNLQSKPIVILDVSIQARYVEVLTKFGTRPKTKIELSMPNNNEEFHDHFHFGPTLTSRFPNAELDCSEISRVGSFTQACIRDIGRLQTLTTLWTQHGKHLDLHLILVFSPIRFPGRNQMKECLMQLSPFISYLILIHWFSVSLVDMTDVVSKECEWPKLSKLEIWGYNNPLEILKRSPNLKKLKLHIAQQSCIFSNQHQSLDESLQEYFGNLHELDYVFLRPFRFRNPVHLVSDEPYPENNIIKFNGLEEFLKGLFPKIKYYDISPSQDLLPESYYFYYNN